jgi:hypothetical protein
MSMWQVVTEFTGPAGTPWLNALYFDVAAGTSVAAASAVDTFWGSARADIDSDVTLTRQSDVRQINEVNGQLEAIESVAPFSAAGQEVGETSPTVLQALIRWRTEVTFDGRLLQGRTFVPGLSESSLVNGVLAPSHQTTFQNAANALIGTVTAALVIWRRPVFSDPPTDPPTIVRNGAFAHVVNASVPNKFAVLRSRRD